MLVIEICYVGFSSLFVGKKCSEIECLHKSKTSTSRDRNSRAGKVKRG
jgi:hypothetical protein